MGPKTTSFSCLLEEVCTYRSDTGMPGYDKMAQYDGENRPVTKQSIVIGFLLACCVFTCMKCLGSDQNK